MKQFNSDASSKTRLSQRLAAQLAGLWRRRLTPVLFLCCLPGIVQPVEAQSVAVWNSNAPLPADPGDVVGAAVGPYHMLLVTRRGTVTGSGIFRNGIYEIPQSVYTSGMTGMVAVAAGLLHSLALRSDGFVTEWGGSGVPEGLNGVVAIAAGLQHSLALKEDGTVTAWGDNEAGQCAVPPGLSGVVAIAADWNYSLALKSDGTVVSWGQDYTRKISRRMDPIGATAVAASAWHSLALKSDGTVVSWGSNYNGQGRVPAGLTGVVELAAGNYYSLALKSDRTLAVWGSAGNLPAAGVPDVAAIFANMNGTVALLGTPGRPPAILGSMRALATGGYGSFRYRIATASPAASFTAAGLPPGLVLDTATGIITGTATQPGRYSVALSATNAHGTDHRELILTVTGKPAWVEGPPENWTVGLPVRGQVSATGDAVFAATGLPPGTGIDPATGVITGAPSLPGLYSVTFTFANPLGTTTKTMEIGVSNIHKWGVGDTPDTSGYVPAGISCAVAVASGRGYTMALRSDGTLASWGRPGLPSPWYVPRGLQSRWQIPPGLDGVKMKAIAAGSAHSLAVREDGTVAAWGDNYQGQCNVPPGLMGVVAVAAGESYSLALKGDGTVTGWSLSGNNARPDQVPLGLSEVKAIAAGADHALALRNDGTVVAWGANYHHQADVPIGLTDVTAIAAGSVVSLALKRDGTVVAWGANLAGQLDLPAGLKDVAAIAADEEHCLALKLSGTVVVWGYKSSRPVINRRVGAVAAGASGSSVLLLTPEMTSPSTASVRISAPFSRAITSWPGATVSLADPPAGLTFNPTTGVLSGSVDTPGRYAMEVTLSYPGYLSAKSTLTLYALDSSFAAWQARCFPGGGTLLTGPADDPDGDGMPNLAEYGRGTDPMAGDAENYVLPSAGGTAGALELILEVLEPVAAELEVQARFGNDPSAPLPDTVPVPAVSQTLDNGYRRFVLRDPSTIPAPRRFGQLLLSQKP